MRIDVHAHLWSEVYLDLLERFGNTTTAVHRGLGAGPEGLDARFALMDRAGIDLQVLSTAPASPHFDNEAHAVEAAQRVNDEYAETVRRHPDRFRAFVSLPLPHTDAALVELGRGLDDLGMLGAAITTSVLGRPVDAPEFLPVYAELDRRGAALFVHPAGVGAASPLIDSTMTWSAGAPIEDTVAITRLILAGIPSRFPNMKIIGGHLGGALPMLLTRMDRQYTWEAPNTPERPSLAARRLWFDTVAHAHTPALRAAADSFGADRLVLGTDFPYQTGEAFQEAVTYVRQAGLTDKDVTAVLDGTAADVLGLSGPIDPA
ncbi:amidohydrolase family protein [Actinocrispum wychmicini]|uniref:Aminocarboxymuconate-semialdehyde decarboxylase n=1 Tax=Actinocrispum wychmicini TaxID=1213861 RepID=A0A4R2J3L8_9PSEU|nr:amidohydrolase family protein [Actinocrispum wychmicini]TCO53113.1 aminocarboxymuconate-semialdehyde decarboxylase [Actinocrispum wychmicini]